MGTEQTRLTLHDIIDAWELDYYTATAVGHLLAWKTYGHLGDLEEFASYLGLAVEREERKPGWQPVHIEPVHPIRRKLHPHTVVRALGLVEGERDVIYRLFEWSDSRCAGCLLGAREAARLLFAGMNKSTAAVARKADPGQLPEAITYFAEVWAEVIPGLPDSYGCELTCSEANAAADFFEAVGRPMDADSVIGAHANYDKPGDEHFDEPDAPDGANPVSKTVSARFSGDPSGNPDTSSGDHGD